MQKRRRTERGARWSEGARDLCGGIASKLCSESMSELLAYAGRRRVDERASPRDTLIPGTDDLI